MDASTRPIKVLSIIEAEYVTGAAKNLLQFARANQDAWTGIHHALGCYRRGASPDSSFLETVRSAGIPAFVLQERGRFDLSIGRRIRRAAREWNADIVETHNVKSHFFARVSGVWRERKWVAQHHGFTAEDAKMRIYNQTARWSLRAAHRVVTVCQPFAEQLASFGVDPRRLAVIHNSVGTPPEVSDEAAMLARKTCGVSPGDRLILCVGRLSAEKGHADLVDAFTQIHARWSGLHLALVGEGPERPRLIESIHARGLAGYVHLVGLQQDVWPFYAIADLVVLPSHSEGSPNVLLEAMAARRPIVATRVGGIPEIVNAGEHALLVNAHDPAALAAAMERLLSDRADRERLIENAYLRVKAGFSPERHWRDWTALYRSVLAD